MNDILLSKIKRDILKVLPDSKAIIAFGSVADDSYVKGVSDIDILVVLDGNLDKEKLLDFNFGEDLPVDVMLTSTEQLSKNIYFISKTQQREMHSIEKYQIKYQSKLIFGNTDILDLIPDISIKEALEDVMPYVKNVFIKQLRDGLEATDDICKFLTENINILLVVIRTIYSKDNGELVSKIKALDYVGIQYGLTKLCNYLKSVYKKEKLNNAKTPGKESIMQLLEILYLK